MCVNPNPERAFPLPPLPPIPFPFHLCSNVWDRCATENLFFFGIVQMRKPFQFRLTFIEISPEQTRQKRTILYILDVFFSKRCRNKHERERGGGFVMDLSVKALGRCFWFWGTLRVCRVKGIEKFYRLLERGGRGYSNTGNFFLNIPSMD
jgi:hypothetical protein